MTLPRIQILEALLLHFRANVPLVDGVPMFRVRHERFRDASREQWPCVSIRYLADDAPDVVRGTDDPSGLSMAESVMELRLELVIDTEIPPESDPETAGDANDGADETGLGDASRIAEICLGSIFRAGEEAENLGGLIWDARYDGTGDNDELATPDNVRLAERLTLVYRVRAEAPHLLLTGE